MAKVEGVQRPTGEVVYYFFCPGCECYHVFDERWQFNGDLDAPTFSPSLLCGHTNGRQCHLFVRGGKIEFLPDSVHDLAGQTVTMAEIEGF